MTTMTLKTLEKDIQIIKEQLARIDEHLKNMNGKLLDCNKHNQTKCPVYRKDIYEKIDNIKTKVTKHGVIFTATNAIFVAVLVAIATGLIGG